VRSQWHRNPQVAQGAENAIVAMKEAGAEIIDPADLPSRDQFGSATFEVLLYEFKDGLNRYLASSSAPLKTLAALIEFNEKNTEKEMPYFGQETFLQAEELTDRAYQAALALCLRLSRQEGIDKVMDEHKLDALVAPTGGPAWFTDLANGDHSGGGSSTPAAVSGYPNITVPMGFVFGLPVGISFFGRAWSEPTLIKCAYAFEQLTKHRRPPQFRPSADISA
jgi:amidase